MNLFIVEDDINFGSVLKSYLEMNDFNVTWVKDGALAIKEFKANKFDLCILDVMLPNIDGFSIAYEIKENDSDIPLIFLTAKSLKADVLKGFKLGADDYICKPFDSDVLLFKIKAILKRNNGVEKQEDNATEFTIGKYTFDYSKRVIILNDTEQKLSPKEADLLKMFCLNVNNVLDRQEALKAIWKEDSYFTTRSMDVYISKLRKYLKDDTSIEILNIHGSGYVLSIKSM